MGLQARYFGAVGEDATGALMRQAVLKAGLADEMEILPGTTAVTLLEEVAGDLDADGDQRLSREEARQVPVVAQNFERLDTDKDGSVSLAEFEKHTGRKSKGWRKALR